MLRPLALLAGALLTLPFPTARADVTVPGFSVAAQPKPAFGAPTYYLPGGDLVTFDGQLVERWSAGGSHVATLATLPSFTFASFVTATADGSTVYFGESSGNGIYRAATDGSGWSQMTTLTFAYDAEVGTDGDLYLSAVPAGPDTELVRVDTVAPYNWTSLGTLAGPSGPLAFDAAGNLYYATQDGSFPPGPGTTDVLRWSASQVAAGGLTEQNATLFGADFDGGSSLDYDDKGGDLLLAETNFGLGEYRVVRVAADKASSPVLVEADAWIGAVHVLEHGSAATLDAYQPASGTNLVYATSDFASYDDLVTLAPARPVLTASGAGTLGQGPVTLTLTGGVPNGTMFLFFCPLQHYSSSESVYNLAGFKFFTGLAPAHVRRVPFLLPTDSSGTGSFTFWNPGDLQGLYAFQALVGGATGAFVGASTSTLF